MGLIKRFVINKEPDMKRTVKKIVQVQPPCTQEMMALMECFRVSCDAGMGLGVKMPLVDMGRLSAD